MSERYVNVDRETAMLLPPDLRDWVEKDDLVHFVVAAVESSDLRAAASRVHGGGSAGYPPAMMLALLVYAYAHGIFSSRQIERATHYHVSLRYVCANLHPDHDTICKFRRENRDLLKAVFGQVLKLAGAMGLLQVGTVCVDGTKILADAAKRRTLTAERLGKDQEQVDRQVEELLIAAESADTGPDREKEHLPKELADRQRLAEKLREARARLEEAVEKRAADRQQDHKQWEQDPIGDPPRAVSGEVQPTDTINLTDPQSVLMPQIKGGYEPSYNAQIGVTGQRRALIVAADVCDQTNDRRQIWNMAVQVKAAEPEVDCIVVDAGYDHARQIERAQRLLGVEIFCPPQKSYERATKGTKKKHRYHEARGRSQQLREQMRQKTAGVRGQELRHLRSTTVEPVFGLIKRVLGFRRFSLRGLEKVRTEWQLVALAFNCRRIALHLHQN